MRVIRSWALCPGSSNQFHQLSYSFMTFLLPSIRGEGGDASHFFRVEGEGTEKAESPARLLGVTSVKLPYGWRSLQS